MSSESEIKIEICVDSVASAIAAAEGGADRLELCQGLDVGGLTPSYGLLKEVLNRIRVYEIPVYMLVRPRAGNFVYSMREIDIMKADIHMGHVLGIDGFVTGALSSDGSVDRMGCHELMEAALWKPVTFHRAFDVTHHSRALEDVIDSGFTRILTSGRSRTATEGLYAINKLIAQAKSRIIIMPGSGISYLNLEQILHGTDAKEIHSSGKDPNLRVVEPECVVRGAAFTPLTCEDAVRRMVKIANLQL
ncbi:copper homeostasis protein cutC homolog [Nephila pilipes]|uniref:Copper homeostasis protein cutC homolog n=1 Tax=Nephila pilipes TaxID=299642 RepID=A0A8X6QFW9_NEPPI|nr:copper homeostasis protein cutC homolog [Nephila pilipes]